MKCREESLDPKTLTPVEREKVKAYLKADGEKNLHVRQLVYQSCRHLPMIAAKLWDFGPEAIRHRALFNIIEYMRINMARYEEARQAGTAAQQELEVATTPETRNAPISKIMTAKNDEHFYWSQMGQVVRNIIEGAKLVMPKPETTITAIATPGGVGIEIKQETRTAKQIMDDLRAKGEL